MKIVVIGGGAVGLSTAFFLARLGAKKVTLLESSPTLGYGSSGRNPGAIRSGFGSEINIQMTMVSKKIMEDFNDLTGCNIHFLRNGYMWMASTEEQAEGLKSVVQSLNDKGIEAFWMSPKEAGNIVPALDISRIVGASFTPEDGIIDPHEFVSGFATAAEKSGVRIMRNYPVESIMRSKKGVTGIRSPKGDLEADIVVDAAGPNAAEIARTANVDVPLTNYWRHSFVSGPAPWVKDPMPFLVDAETGGYFRQTGGSLIFGRGRGYESDEPAFSAEVDPGALGKAVATAKTIIPDMESTSVMYGYAGLFAMTPDFHCILGPVSNLRGFYLACGFSGHGLMHAPAAGLLLAEWITRGGKFETLDAKALQLGRFDKGETIVESLQI